MFDIFHKTTHRRELEKYLRRFASKVIGNVLDVGSGNRRYDHFFTKSSHITAVDIVANPTRQVAQADVNYLPFQDEMFDVVLGIELLEYITTPQQAVSEMLRVLKQGGVLMLSVPLMYRFHEDQLRFTEKYLREHLLRDVSSLEIYSVGNYYTIFLDMILIKVHKIRFALLRYFLYIFILPIFLLRPLAEFIAHDPEFASGYFVYAKK